MKSGDKLRLRGSGGAPFVVTVGDVFTAEDITRRIRTGEWARLDDEPSPEQAPTSTIAPQTATPAVDPQGKTPDPDRPAVNAPKGDWVAYVARTHRMSMDDASMYTKADLIEMVG